MRSDIYLFNHWGDCLLIVVAARPDLPYEVNEQAPQHQIDDNEGYGEPQGHIVEVIEEIHLHTKSSIFFFTNLRRARAKCCLNSQFDVSIRDFTCLNSQNKTIF